MGQPGKNIMIIEDEGLIAMSTRSTLEMAGYNVPETSLTGEEAIELLKQAQPDLVIIDITLDGVLDGIAVAEHINEFYKIPIIYLTAHTDREIVEQAQATKPSSILFKPCENNDLLKAVSSALG